MASKLQHFCNTFIKTFGEDVASVRVQNPRMGEGCTIDIDTQKIHIMYVKNQKPIDLIVYFKTDTGIRNGKPMNTEDMQKAGKFLEKFGTTLKEPYIKLEIKKRDNAL